MSIDTQIKCQKCRTVATRISSEKLLDAHHNIFSKESSQKSTCPTMFGMSEIYIAEDVLEQWMQDEIAKSEWTKGKLKCTKCASNIGSFDFIAGQKCECRRHNQPSVHLIMSKIDVEKLNIT